MIPGHNLVGYVERSATPTIAPDLAAAAPFYGEGWPLYWELTLYDLGFHKTPEQKVGALFWRMHRCARIIFSLKFHMGEWSPQESDRLPRRHASATSATTPPRKCAGRSRAATVRSTRPAYLLGGLQLRGLRQRTRRHEAS